MLARKPLRIMLCALVLGLSATSGAQQISGTATGDSDLPDAPGQESPLPKSLESQSTANISGTVLDINEGAVPHAQITLETLDGTARHIEVADTVGFFSFKNLSPGTFKVRITAPGLEPFESYEITLHAGEKYQLPKVALPIVVARLELNVTITEEQLAQEQVDAQIQQRVFGIFPNFYTSFIWNAAPLRPRQKFHLALRASTDPVSFLNPALLAALQQARNTYPGYGQGAKGYAKRYGADYADIFIGHMLSGAVFASIFHQDPRYFYQGTGSIRSRAWHAVSSALICRGDNGHLQFNYSHVLGNLAAGGISNLYRPEDDRGLRLTIDNALLHTAALAGANLLREFALRSITTKVPSYANGKQPIPAPSRP
jgi:hypothetical protein